MGYYSNVAMAVHKKDYLQMLAKAREKESEPGEITYLLTEACDYIGLVEQNDRDKDVVVLHWCDVKWYSDFESVRFVENWMDDADENGIGYEFARCGEDFADTETRYHDDNHILGYGEYVGVVHEVWLPYAGNPYFPEIPDPLSEEPIEPVNIDDLFADAE